MCDVDEMRAAAGYNMFPKVKNLIIENYIIENYKVNNVILGN